MTKVTVNGQEFDTISDAISVLNAMYSTEQKKITESLPHFAVYTRRELYCSWCGHKIEDNVFPQEQQQTEYEHIRKVHPEAEKFFFARA